MVSVSVLLALVWLHFLSDFILQSDYVAKNKSTNNKVLFHHVALYSIPFLLFGVQYAIINGMIHFCVDWCTSRITSKLWAGGKVHWFFVTIGFDQAIHLSTLILTYIWLV